DRVPNLDSPLSLVTSGRRQALAVGAKRYARDPAGQSVEFLELLDAVETCNIPDDDLSPAGSGQVPAVGGESHTLEVVLVPQESADQLTVRSRGFPELDFKIRISGSQIIARRVERHAKNACLMPWEGADLVAAVYIPDLSGSRVANCSDVLSVSVERHAVDKFGISLTGEKLLTGLGAPELEP